MTHLFFVVLSLSVSGGLVGLLILAFRPFAGRYFAKRWTYYLWLLVLVRLLVPVHTDLNLMEYLSEKLQMAGRNLTNTGGVAEPGEAGGYAGAVLEGLSDELESADGAEAADRNLREDSGSAVSAVSVNGTNGGIMSGIWKQILQMASVIWLVGVLFTALWKVWIYGRFVQEVRAGCAEMAGLKGLRKSGEFRAARVPVTDGRILGQYMEICRRLGVQKVMPLYESAAIESPMLIGICNPCIYLPSGILVKMKGKENDIGLILHHELIHYKRRDIWYKWLFQIALCVHWFNPLVYVFNRRFNVDCELACDETVLKFLSEEGRRAYGNVLLNVAQKSWTEGMFVGKGEGVYRNVPTMTLLEEKSTLKERLRGIAQYHKTGIAVGLCSVAAMVMFLAAALVCGAAGVRSDSGNAYSMRREGNFIGLIEHFWEKTLWTEMWGDSFDLDQPMMVSSDGKAYRMFDDDALIAKDSENDFWRAWTYMGGEKSVSATKFVLNGSDTLWILYANAETTLELSSVFDLYDGRFKVVCVKSDQTVQTLNESGEENTVKITLPKGRNVIKIVGQKAKLKNLNIVYGGMRKGDFDRIYTGEQQEYAYQVLEGKTPVDVTRLEEVFPHLKGEEVSELCRIIWEDDAALSKKDWQNMFIYSDVKTTDQYLLEKLETGGLKDFDSGILVQIAPYMRAQDVSECFRYLLERDMVSESDWGDIFVYADADKSAEYLVKALRKGKAGSFSDKALEEICYRVSTKELTDIVTAMDELSFEGLEHVLAFVQQMDEAADCICHYIDLGNTLTDEQMRKIKAYLSEEDFYRVVEYNGRKK